MKLVAKGAEANLYLDDGKLVKERVAKKYRIDELDRRLRKSRTKREAKNLERLKKAGLSVPEVYKVDEKKTTIIMEYINGRTLKQAIEELDDDRIGKLGKQIGRIVAKVHDDNMIHNDLTTSNMILKGDEIYLIDMGLGFHSTRVEDKAMDLVVFKKSLLATHPGKFDTVWNSMADGYGKKKEIFKRVEQIEKRVRYA
ncbi:MAG: KEOPS complex kinase/ATPase Bud32 [Candidatus Altiarchaeota archaeon]